MKKILLLSVLIVVASLLFGQQKSLKFNADKRFKIVQFTDVHHKYGEPESSVAIKLIKEVVDAEKPDLVVFTGDVIFAPPALKGLKEVFTPVIKRHTPWAYVFGNHDDEFSLSRTELMDYVCNLPYSLAQAGDQHLKGVGNYVVEIRDSKGKNIKTLLYFMDSGSYSSIKEIGGYAWFDFNQVDWYKRHSETYTKLNGGIPTPSLAFFHIPLPEYALMTSNKDIKLIGDKDEAECAPEINTGMFAAMRQSGDIIGTFVGHDHNNDYIGLYKGICLAYGRFSGGQTVYYDKKLNGCRVIELEEGEREFSTYIRLMGGAKLFHATYPTSFVEQKNE